MLGACGTTVTGENILPLQGQEEKSHSSSGPVQPTSVAVMPTGHCLASHFPHVT